MMDVLQRLAEWPTSDHATRTMLDAASAIIAGLRSDLAAANNRADEAEASARFQTGMTDATQRQLCDAQRDLAAALERAEKAEARSVWPRDAILSITGGPPDWSADQIVCMVEHFADEAGRVIAMEAERDAALERARMALWALALERLEGLPEGWRVSGPMARHASGGRLLRRWSEGGCTAAAGDGQMQRYPTVHAAILSIDPTAKPPEGWTP